MECWGLTLPTLPAVPLLSVSAVSLAASLLYLLHRRRKNPLPLPPGPRPLRLLAKLMALQRRSPFDIGPFLRQLHARHGPVISLRLLTTSVFIADRGIAHRVLVRDGAAFADRPPRVEPNPLFNAGSINFAPYGPYWRLVRRNLAAEALHRARVGLLAPARRWACDGLVASLRRVGVEPAAVVTVRPFLRRAMLDLLLYMCFGVRLARDAVDEIEELERHALLSATAFPVFAFWPAVTKRIYRRRWESHVAVRQRQHEVYTRLIHAARCDAGGCDDGGHHPPCYAESLLALRVAEEGDRPLTDAEMVSLCSEFVSAGTDTTVTLLEWIMAELVNHQDVQAKVYEEVARAKPELDDTDNLQALPYLKAVVLEGLRLHPPAHYLVPHAVGSDDAEIGGYKVPKGAEVNFMVAEIGRDEAVWTAAREFRPERFLDGGEGSGVDITGSREIKMMPFGAGRRMCPGYALGMRHAEFFVGTLVREMNWLPAAEGETVDMAETVDFTIVMKNPLRARIVPRIDHPWYLKSQVTATSDLRASMA